MRSAQEWLTDYGRTHQNPVNKRIHFVCVPLIMWSLLAMLWTAPVPQVLSGLRYFNWAVVLVALACVFYARLGMRHLLGMVCVAGVMLGSAALMEHADWPLATIAFLVFVVAWVGQFYGHKREGKKPSFFEDLLFLLIGPLWILDHLTTSSRSRPERVRR